MMVMKVVEERVKGFERVDDMISKKIMGFALRKM